MATTPNSSRLKDLLDFYGLRELPFGVSPDPRFLYPSPQHREALSSLSFGIENQVGIVALIAEPGIGKTTLLFDILHRHNQNASTAFIFNTQCSGPELLRQVVVELQIPDAEIETDPIRLHQMFTAFAASQMRTKPVVIIIDEAQNLENKALETLRLLSNFEAADQKLLHIILAGQPQLADKLRHPSLTQLLQRVTMVSRLERFSRQEIEECIKFRLQVAGFDGEELFSAEALDLIANASGGIPREMNRICLNAMQRGFVGQQRQIGINAVEEILADLTLTERMPVSEPSLAATELPGEASAWTSFRVGSSVSSHPQAPRDPFSAADSQPPPPYRPVPAARPALAQPPSGISASSSQEHSPAAGAPEHEDAASRRQQELYWERQKALLRAAAQRRQAAEYRLKGLRSQMEDGARASHASQPAQFDTGSEPELPGDGSRRRMEEGSPAPGAASSFSEQEGNRSGFQAGDGEEKKTGT